MTAPRTSERIATLTLASAFFALMLLYLVWCFGLGDWALKPISGLLIASILLLMAAELVAGRWLTPAFLLCLTLVAMGSPTGDWDARSIWLFHAKRIYIDHNLGAQLDGYANWSHNDYPVLVPAVSAALAIFVGFWNEILPKLAGVLVMAPALVLLARRLPSVFGQIAFLCLLLFCAGSLLVNGYMDGLLAVYYVAAFVLTCELFGVVDDGKFASRAQTWTTTVITVIVFSVLTLLKNEGLFALASILGGVGLLAMFRKRRISSRAVLIVAASLLTLFHWKWLVASHGIVNDLTSTNLLQQLLERLPNLYFHILILKALFLRPQIMLPLALFGLLAWRYRRDAICQGAGVAGGSYSVVIFLVYLSTPIDLGWHLQTSADRTLLPVALLLGYVGIHHIAHSWLFREQPCPAYP